MSPSRDATNAGGNRRLSAVLGGGSLLPAAVLELGLKLCVALREVYAVDESGHGLEPHEREFRPENVLLTPGGDVVSGDLGLPDFGAPPRDKPVYRAPEQFRGAPRDRRSDVFVIAALVYEATVGEPLFDGPNGADAQFAVEHGLEGHLVLKDMVRTVDARIEGLGGLLEGCLLVDPGARFADPAELGARIAQLLGRSGLQPGSLAKRVAMTPEEKARSVSMPAAPLPKPAPELCAPRRRAPSPARSDPPPPAKAQGPRDDAESASPPFPPPREEPQPAPRSQPAAGAAAPFPPAAALRPQATEPFPPATEPSPPPTVPFPPLAEPLPPATEPSPRTTVPFPPLAEPSPPATVPFPPTAEHLTPATVPFPPLAEPSPPATEPPPGRRPPPPDFVDLPDVSEPAPLAPMVLPPAVPPPAPASWPGTPRPEPVEELNPPPPPSWLTADEQPDAGSSVELSIDDIGRERPEADEAGGAGVAPPPPLAEAGSGFKLQAEEDPESIWNRLPPLEAPPELQQSEARLDSSPPPTPLRTAELLPRAPQEAVPLRRTALSMKSDEPGEETLAGAIRWFLSRILLYSLFLATIAFALAWYDVFPDATRKAAGRAWDATPAKVKDAIPAPWGEAAVDLWANRVGAGAGRGLGAVVVKVVPEDVARSVEEVVAGAEATPTPLDAGSPRGDGIVRAAAGWVEEEAEAKAGEGLLLIDAELEGRPLGETVRVEVLDAQGVVVAEGVSGASIATNPGEWTARLTYRESDSSGEHVGTVTGLRTHVAHRSRYRTRVDLAVGFLDTRFLVDAVDVSREVVLRGWPPRADREASPPAWTGPGGAGLALPAGQWFVVAEYDDGRHAATRLDLGRLEVPAQHGRVSRKKSLQQGEELNPTGPGMDIEVSNFGEEVSGQTEIYVYRAGDDVRHATAVAAGRGAYYFDVPAGSYDVRLVFRPSNLSDDVVGEKTVTGLRVTEATVLRTKVDIGFAYSTLDVLVTLDDADVSDKVRIVVIGPGASFEGANRVLDGYLGHEHVIVSGTYDIYLVFDSPEGEVRRHFSMVDLKQGRLWKQRFSMNDAEWIARD